MKSEIVCAALIRGMCIELRYDGFSRIVEAHACGLTEEGHAVARVWQVRGGSVHNEPVGWKLLRLDEAALLEITDEVSLAPRPGYKRNDKVMRRIICQL